MALSQNLFPKYKNWLMRSLLFATNYPQKKPSFQSWNSRSNVFARSYFGKKVERFISTDPNVRQLDIFGEALSDQEKAALEKAAQQEQELITKTITVNKPRTPRKTFPWKVFV